MLVIKVLSLFLKILTYIEVCLENSRKQLQIHLQRFFSYFIEEEDTNYHWMSINYYNNNIIQELFQNIVTFYCQYLL